MKIHIQILILFFLSAIAVDNSIDEDLQMLQSTQFGQTIIQTIQMQLESDDPVQNLIEMLQTLDSRLETEQKRDDDLHDRFQKSCSNDLDTLTAIINDCVSKSKILKTQLDQLNPQKTQKVGDLSRKNTELINLQEEVDHQSNRRETENTKYKATLDQLEASLFTINESKKMFNKFLDVLEKNKRKFGKKDSLLQKQSYLNSLLKNESEDSEDESEKENEFDGIFSETNRITTFSQISQKLNKLKHQMHQEGFKVLLSSLAFLSNQLHSQQNPAQEQELMTRKILEIIVQVENFITKSRENEDLAEQSRREAFQLLYEMYTKQIIFTKQEQAELQGAIESLSNQIQGADNEKFEVDSKLSTKQTELGDRQVECTNEGIDYETEKKKRSEERDSLTLALDIITSKLGLLKKKILESGF